MKTEEIINAISVLNQTIEHRVKVGQFALENTNLVKIEKIRSRLIDKIADILDGEGKPIPSPPPHSPVQYG